MGGAASPGPSWKDRPPRQSPAPSRADPAAKGQKNGVRAKPRKALSTKDQDKLPTGQVPPTGSSRAKAAPSLHPGKGPQLRGSGPPNQHPLGQATKPARREVATGPPGTGSRGGQLCFGNHRAKREGEKENQGVTAAAPPPPEKKRAISWGSLRGPSQATSKEPREKDHRAAGHVPHTSTQVPLGRPAEELARGRPRDWSAISQRAPVARPSLRFGRAPGVCRPAADSRGPRAAKPLGSAPVPVKGGPLAGVDHLAPLALQGRPRQQQVKGGPAVLADGRPHGHRLAPQRLPKASSAARGGIDQKRSPGRSEKSGPRAPRTPRARPGPPAADHPAAVLTGAPTGCGRRLLHSNTRRPRGPQSPSPQDRRKLLEEWLASRGKIYKRPPMVLLAKRSPEEKASLNLSFWHRMEEEEGEEEEVHAQRSLASDFSSTLAECLKLAEEGALPEQLLASISRIPEVEKFAQFWICKARCLAQGGPFDAAGLYEAALRSGAAPLRELQDAMADILKDSNQTPHAAPTQARTQARLLPGETQVDSSPQGRKQGPAGKPASAVKIQVVPLFRANERGAKLDMQLLTPVRRSLRIEEAAAGYPPMLKEHRLVVSSLDEIPASDLESHFLFRNNLALPEGVGLTGLRAGLPPLGQNHLLGTPHLLPS